MKCMLCLQDSMSIRFDKKSRPYMRCDACRHNIFIRSGMALASVLLWSQAVSAMNQEQLTQAMHQRESVLKEIIQNNEKVKTWLKEEVLV